MTNNSQTLKNLIKSAESVQKENERITKEIMQQSLSELEQNLTNSFKQKMNTIENRFNETLEYSKESINKSLSELDKAIYQNQPMRFKLSSLAMSFLVGMLTMTILSGIVWYQWIRPYQVSKNQTIKNNQGTLFIGIPKRNIIEQGDYYYYPIQ